MCVHLPSWHLEVNITNEEGVCYASDFPSVGKVWSLVKSRSLFRFEKGDNRGCQESWQPKAGYLWECVQVSLYSLSPSPILIPRQVPFDAQTPRERSCQPQTINQEVQHSVEGSGSHSGAELAEWPGDCLTAFTVWPGPGVLAWLGTHRAKQKKEQACVPLPVCQRAKPVKRAVTGRGTRIGSDQSRCLFNLPVEGTSLPS